MTAHTSIETRLRSHPDDWEAWLVYADWLSDRGDARGELIALEHRLATRAPKQAEQRRIRARITALTASCEPEWLSDWGRPAGTRIRWHFGFAREVIFPRSQWARGILPAFEALAAHPEGWMLRRLAFSPDEIADDVGGDVAALACSSALEAIEALDLYGNNAGSEGVTALARSPHLSSLIALDLGGNSVYPADAAALARSSSFPSLRTLSLRNNAIGDGGAAVIARSSAFPSLTELDLSSNEIGDEGAAALAGSTTLGNLHILRLNGNFVGNEGTEALQRARSGNLSALDELDLPDPLPDEEEWIDE